MSATKVSGVVKCFSTEKGFGFIPCADSQDAFFHRTEIKMGHAYAGLKFLEEGTRVEFVLRETEKGLRAERVQRAPE